MRKIVMGLVVGCLIGLISTGAWSQEKELIYG